MNLGVRLFFGLCPTPNQPGKPSSVCFIDSTGARSFEAHINYPGVDPVQDSLYRRFGEDNGCESSDGGLIVECCGDLPYVCARVREWLNGFPVAPEIWAVSVPESLAGIRAIRVNRMVMDLTSVCYWVGVIASDVIMSANRDSNAKTSSSIRHGALCAQYIHKKMVFLQNEKNVAALERAKKSDRSSGRGAAAPRPAEGTAGG